MSERDMQDIAVALTKIADIVPDRLADIESALGGISKNLESIDKHMVEMIDRERG